MSKVLYPSVEEFNEVIDAGVVLVDFYADWCGPCKMLGPELEKLAENYDGKVKIVKVNTDKAQSLAMQYRVSSIPALFVLKDGKVVDQSLGYRPYPMLENLIKNHI